MLNISVDTYRLIYRKNKTSIFWYFLSCFMICSLIQEIEHIFDLQATKAPAANTRTAGHWVILTKPALLSQVSFCSGGEPGCWHPNTENTSKPGHFKRQHNFFLFFTFLLSSFLPLSILPSSSSFFLFFPLLCLWLFQMRSPDRTLVAKKPGWPLLPSRDLPTSTFQGLALKACATMPGSSWIHKTVDKGTKIYWYKYLNNLQLSFDIFDSEKYMNQKNRKAHLKQFYFVWR